MGRMSAAVAHEIRNPLAAMRGAIQVLRSEMPADSTQRELMEIVLRESDRLNRIITDFLTYARPRKVALVETDLREPLQETFALLRHSPDLDHVIIETTGLANPGPVAQTFFMDDEVASHFLLDAVVTVVDARHGDALHAEHGVG